MSKIVYPGLQTVVLLLEIALACLKISPSGLGISVADLEIGYPGLWTVVLLLGIALACLKISPPCLKISRSGLKIGCAD